MKRLYRWPIVGKPALWYFGNGGKDAVTAPRATLRDWIVAYDTGVRSIQDVTGWRMRDYVVRCHDVPSEASFGAGVWGWREQRVGWQWVLGLYMQGKAFSAVGPQGQIQHGTMKHEAGGHHPLVMNKGIWGHYPPLDGEFSGWKATREATGMSIATRPNVIVHPEIVHTPDGDVHADVIDTEPLIVYADLRDGKKIDRIAATQPLTTWGEMVV